jgi:DNA-binding SARP family transcriptional activator/tetratricopeptide (TPR) repeat protein
LTFANSAAARRSRDIEDNAMLAVQLFGAPQIRLYDQSLDALRRKNRALLYFVAAHAQSLSRDQVLARFWPDHERGAAQQVFRTMLHEIRKSLGDTLIADRDMLGLADTADVDVRAFDAGIAARASDSATLERTLALYRGDFLDGFTLVDTPAFDDWVAAERERYRLLAIRGFVSLARLYEADHAHAAALGAVDAALRLDALQEDLHRTAMRLHYATGDRAGAIRQFELLRHLLNDELGVAPMPETRALYDAIITERLERDKETRRQGDKEIGAAIISLSPPLPISLSPLLPVSQSPVLPFTGRAHECHLIQRAIGEGKLAVIEGTPGIGKTRLGEEWAAQHPALMLRGAAHELEQSLPYQPVIEALRSLTARPDWPGMRENLELAPLWLHEAARLVPELAADPEVIVTSPPNESQMWESVARLLQALAQRQPVLLFLDDLHWADDATLGLVGYLARRTPSPALRLLGTTWTVEPKSKQARLLQSLAREGKLERIMLPPLSTADLATLAEAWSGSPSGWLSDWIADISEGNPFFANELLRFANSNDWLRASAPTAALGMVAAVPGTIRDLIASRIDRLSEPARRALDIAAVIGREFSFDLIVAVSQSDEISALDACDELRAAALVQPTSDEYFRFDHSLTLDVVLREMGTTRNRALHRRVAEALERAHSGRFDEAAGAIAQHYLAGNASDRAAPYALRAGQFAASVAAWPQAIAFFEQTLAAGVNALRVPAFMGLSEAHLHYGELQAATQAAISALDAARGVAIEFAAAEVIYDTLLVSLIPQGRYAEVIAFGEALRRDGPPELALCAEYMLGCGLNVAGAHPEAAVRHLQEAERLLAQPRSFQSRITLAKLRFQRANVLGQLGKIDQAIAMFWEVLTLVRKDESVLDLQMHILLYNQLAHYLRLVGDPVAIEYAQAGLMFAREKGSLTHQSYLLSTSGEIMLAQGDLDAAERFFSEGLALAEQLATCERIAGLTANLGLVAQRRGQLALARERLASARALADQLGAQHLVARICLWLIPLLPSDEARALLSKTRTLVEQGGYGKLLDELAALAQDLG